MKKILIPTLLCASSICSAVNIKSDAYLLGLVGQKPVETEDVSYSYNTPTKIYFYSPVINTGFDLQLNKDTADIVWMFSRKDKIAENKKAEQMAISFTEKLLGKQAMDLLIKPMKAGNTIKTVKISGVTINNARCSSSECMYSVVR